MTVLEVSFVSLASLRALRLADAAMATPPPGDAVDVSIRCGVINHKHVPCLRSLTCKSHSMTAKRSSSPPFAVVSRSPDC